MIYITRSAPPAWFNSPEVEQMYERQKEYMSDKDGITRGRLDTDQFTLPMDMTMEKEVVQLFKNKCPFCESLVVGAKAAFFTPEISIQREKFKTLIANSGQLESTKKSISRSMSYQVDNKEEEGFEVYDIGFFRPEYRAMNVDGKVSPLHYWWLGWDWDNLFLICRSCLMAKENKFPVKGKRAVFPNTTVEKVRKGIDLEKPLLLDPCKLSSFEQRHIYFKEGFAVGLTQQGKTTIDTFKLNRPKLLAVRKLVCQKVVQQIETSEKKLSTGHPFIAAIIDAWWLTSDQNQRALETLRQFFVDDLPGYLQEEAQPDNVGYSTETIADTIVQEREERKKQDYNLEKKENLSSYFTNSIWIEKVQLTDFKAFKKLEVNFPDASSQFSSSNMKTDTTRPWLALLGENGVGKSSISQAIALTLMGEKKLKVLSTKVPLSDFIRFHQSKAEVKVFLLNQEDPITLTITRTAEGATFELSEKTPQVLMMAYGATRLPSKDSQYGNDGKSFIRVNNLFDPNAKLGNGFAWLADEKEIPDTLFEQLSGGLINLLQQLSIGSKIGRDTKTKELYIRSDKDVDNEDKNLGTPFKYLSSGYQTVLAIILDIMMGAAELLKSPVEEEENFDEEKAKRSILDVAGIVMIDEIGVHLHPRWKMRIVKDLKRTFPKMSFIITTHEPLCLRGLLKGEVVVLQKDKDQTDEVIIIDKDLPSIQELSIQELLTSTFFGLNSIMDPVVEQTYDEYYQLLAKVNENRQEGSLTEKEQEIKDKLLEIEKKLKQMNLKVGNRVTEEIEFQLIQDKVNLARNKQDVFKEIGEVDKAKIKDTWEKMLSS